VERMRRAAASGCTLATEIADYQASKGVPFREADGIVGQIVRMAIDTGRDLEELRLAELRRFSPRFERDIYRWLTVEAAVGRRRAPGGTAPAAVRKQLKAARHRWQKHRRVRGGPHGASAP